ncbi:MAG: DUF4928 family protein [Terriglobales bacterium]
MSKSPLRRRLEQFARQQGFASRSAVALALVVTSRARGDGLPLEPSALLTPGGGQVAGQTMAAVQRVLRRHGISAVLATEGGRTSQGSVARMRAYSAFLNSLGPGADLASAEAFWAGRARRLIARAAAPAPLRLRLPPNGGVRAAVRSLILEAKKRQRRVHGLQYAGAVLQHLVGAKLQCALPEQQFEHHGFSGSGSPGSRAGDFEIGDVAIHVTMAPGDSLIARCRENIEAGLQPVIITVGDGTAVATGLARQAELGERVDVLDAEQFVAINVYKLGRFTGEGRRASLGDIISRYNAIVAEHETDPSLKIELRP